MTDVIAMKKGTKFKIGESFAMLRNRTICLFKKHDWFNHGHEAICRRCMKTKKLKVLKFDL